MYMYILNSNVIEKRMQDFWYNKMENGYNVHMYIIWSKFVIMKRV